MSHPTKLPPPHWLENIVSALLPTSRQEQVLGDLKERCVAERSYPNARYMLDAVTALPHVWWSAARRSFEISPLKLASTSTAEIQQRTRAVRGVGVNPSALPFLMFPLQIAHMYPGFPWGSVGIQAALFAVLVVIVWSWPISPWIKRPVRVTRIIPYTTFPMPDVTRETIVADYRAALQEQRMFIRPVYSLYSATAFTLLAAHLFPLFWGGRRTATAQIMQSRAVALVALFALGYALCFLRGRLRAWRLQKQMDSLESTL